MSAVRMQRGRFFGSEVGRRAIGPFEFTETVYRHGEQLVDHEHEDPTVYLVLSGCVEETTPQGAIRHRSLTSIASPGGYEHRTSFHGRRPRILNIQFRGSWLRSHRWSLSERRSVLCSPITAPTIVQLHAMLHDRGASELDLEATIGAMLSPPPRRRGKRTAARTAARVIQNDPSSRFRLSELADALGVDRTGLAHAFRREFGVSMREFAARRRFAEACALIADHATSLASVALRAGYADQPHLTRDFRARVGMTPAQYRSLVV